MLLKEKEIDLHKETIAKGNESQAELSAQHKAIRKNISELKEKITLNLEANEELARNIRQLDQEQIDVAGEYNPWNNRISEAEKALANHERESKVLSLVSEFPAFESVLESRIDMKQKELSSLMPGFMHFVDPKEASTAIAENIDSNRMSDKLIRLREAKYNYESSIRSLCEMRLDGKQISIANSQAHISEIDIFICDPLVERFWNTNEQQAG